MLPTAGDIHCLGGENNTVLLLQESKTAHTHPPQSLKGDKGKGLICIKEEGKPLAEKIQKYTPLLPDTGKKKGC